MIVTLAEVKTYLNVSGNELDGFLQTEIDIISEAIENYCRRKFKAANYRETIYDERASLFPHRVIPLYNYPVISVDAFDNVYPGPTGTDVEAEIIGYRLHKPTGRIMDFNHDTIFSGSNRLVIEYRAGYEEVPAPLKSVVFSLVGESYNKKTAGVSGLTFGSNVKSVSIPGTIGIDFATGTTGSESRTSSFGKILGNYSNVLDYYRSDRALLGPGSLYYVEELPE